MTDRNPVSVHALLEQLANALGVTPEETLGFSVAIAFRWEARDHGLFISGTAADLVDRVANAFGATLAPGTAITVEAEHWLGGGADAIGFGPVAGADATARYDLVRATEQPSVLTALQGLRARLLESSLVLETGLDSEPDLATLTALHAARPQDVTTAVSDLATTRRIVGRYLLDAGDLYDDERIDQLGDGYLRASGLWDAVAAEPDGDLVADAIALERACLGWMRGAADPPTRYAF